jgi:hypothetical protein
MVAPIGLVVGLALITKYTIAFWIVALLLGLLLTSARGCLAGPGPYKLSSRVSQVARND